LYDFGSISVQFHLKIHQKPAAAVPYPTSDGVYWCSLVAPININNYPNGGKYNGSLVHYKQMVIDKPYQRWKVMRKKGVKGETKSMFPPCIVVKT